MIRSPLRTSANVPPAAASGAVCSTTVPYAVPLMHVDDAELARRRALWTAPKPAMDSGYWKLYIDHVMQADEGADLDFLRGKRGSAVPKDNH